MKKNNPNKKKLFSREEKKILEKAANIDLNKSLFVGDIVLSANCVIRRNIEGEKFIQQEESDLINRLNDTISPSLSTVCGSVYRKKTFEEQKSRNLMLAARSPFISSLLSLPINTNYHAYLGENRKNNAESFNQIFSDTPSRFTLLGYDDHITHIITASNAETAFATAFEDIEKIGKKANVKYASDESFGYLTAKPEFCGSGATMAILLALPALAIKGGLDAVFKGLQRIGYDVVPAVDSICDEDEELAEVQRLRIFGSAAPGALYYITAQVPQENYVEFLKQFVETAYAVASAEAEERLSLAESIKLVVNLDKNISCLVDLYDKGPRDIMAVSIHRFILYFLDQFILSHLCLFDALSCLCINRVFNIHTKKDNDILKNSTFSPYAQYLIHEHSFLWHSNLFFTDLICLHSNNDEILLDIIKCCDFKNFPISSETPDELICLEDVELDKKKRKPRASKKANKKNNTKTK